VLFTLPEMIQASGVPKSLKWYMFFRLSRRPGLYPPGIVPGLAPGEPTSMLVREKRRSPVSAPGEIGGEPDMWVEGGAFLAPALLASYHQWYLACFGTFCASDMLIVDSRLT
jgi:hypothetical protein